MYCGCETRTIFRARALNGNGERPDLVPRQQNALHDPSVSSSFGGHFPQRRTGFIEGTLVREKQANLLTPSTDQNVRFAVAIEIALAHAPASTNGRLRHGLERNIREMSFPVILPGAQLEGNEPRHLDRADEKILVPVAVQVDDRAGPAREAVRGKPRCAFVPKPAFAVVDEEPRLGILLPAVIVAGDVEEENIVEAVAVGVKDV